MNQEDALSGQVALVTGASRGIGLAIARRLGQMGARVSICARIAGEAGRSEVYLACRRALKSVAFAGGCHAEKTRFPAWFAIPSSNWAPSTFL